MSHNNHEQAQAIFAARRQYNALTRPESDFTGGSAVLYNDLVKLAQSGEHPRRLEIMAQINQSLPLRRQFMQLVKTFAYEVSGAQAAASGTDELEPRKSDKFTLSFTRDPVQTSQIYVILTVNFPTAAHCEKGVNLHVESRSCIYLLHFPPLTNNKTQSLLEETSPALQALLDASADIVIMN